MKSAAYVCIRTLMQCAQECEQEHPKVAEIIRNNFYVDDLLSSESDAKSAIALYHELNDVMRQYGFTLAKWDTNDPTVSAVIHGGGESIIEMDKDNINAVLGVNWSPTRDEFQYKIKNPPSDEKPTKRTIVSDIMRLFDPDGFISPVVVRAKILIQRLWLRKMDWDDVVEDSADEESDHIARDWIAFRKELSDVQKIRIPRWIQTEPGAPMQIHGFSDASQEAFGVAFYIHVEKGDGTFATNLVFLKTRVAPLTEATVPKLELSAAHLIAKVLPSIMEQHGITIENCHLHTDSMIALQWLRKSPAKLETFQANRVAEIQELTEGAHWSHVATKDNPSDLCSRGMSPTKLSQSNLWWHGPLWLNLPMNQWPKFNLTIGRDDVNIILAAVKKPKPIVTVGFVDLNSPIVRTIIVNGIANDVGLHRAISDWKRFLRVTVYVV